ncbi:ABC transporter substrate-binding protein [Salinadaptatus halalkaliphilus]|uniref:ABC transporter substrate-binding protein n=1 Tax=Salinadaptatus halalkaliphilus TaxID=2419781 RepID=A0A4S3TK02_9EURY|nr:ABC transporter substrate-binding protein [Salinadaptatus halalkaliphilus]THE64412.1 ABC transporter substrate-binding protein [Salinadaptatus halalkaliphilus]
MDGSEGHANAGTRRAFLGWAGATATVGLAGCITAIEDRIDADSEGAQQIQRGLEAAGIEPPVETTIYANAENSERVRWTQLVQHALNETGLFDVGFESLEWSQYEQLCFNMAENEENALVSLDVSGGWDPHSYVEPLFHSANHAPAGLNFNHFAADGVDELIEDGLAEDDPDRRREIYAELQRELVEHVPVSPIRFGESVTVYRQDSIDDWRQYPLPGSEYESVYAPYAGVSTDADGGELVGDAVAVVSNTDPINMHDTTSNMATGLLYEGLLAVDFDGTPQPQLAADWTQLEETTYRFDLREDVNFHNGETLTAEHVRFSLDRYEGTPRENDVFEWYDHTEIVDETTLEIHLTEPYGPFETSVGLPIVPLAADEDDGVDLSATPVGTGPYEFADRSDGEYWDLERFDDHWFDGDDDVPAEAPIETVRMRIIDEPASRQAALETGEIDLATGVPTESVGGFVDDDSFAVERTVAGQFDFLIYPRYLEPFDRTEVRRGIDRLLPRTRILEDVYDGYGSVAYTTVPPLLEAFADPDLEDEIVAEYFE